ncbi:MAG: type II toxin-antitoxin system ParD family antitoxin, partial [Ktedonobacteraceae bacterium]
MPGTEKISITLTPELAAMVNDAVANGDYASTSEVIREALRDWRMKQMVRQQQLHDMRHLWNEAVASGPGRFHDIEELIQE